MCDESEQLLEMLRDYLGLDPDACLFAFGWVIVDPEYVVTPRLDGDRLIITGLWHGTPTTSQNGEPGHYIHRVDEDVVGFDLNTPDFLEQLEAYIEGMKRIADGRSSV